MSNETQEIPVLLGNGADGKPVILYVEVRQGYGEAPVSSRMVEGLQDVFDAIGSMAAQVADAVKTVSPDKVTIQLGFEMKAEAGGLVAMLVRTGGSSSLQVSLEWAKDPPALLPSPPS